MTRGIAPGRLWPEVERRTAEALAVGALAPIRTTTERIDDGGLPFHLRVVDSLVRKAAARQAIAAGRGQSGAPANPFLPYDPQLYVADITPSHVGLLNKYNVLEHHLLIVTRLFEHQETLLTTVDMEALWAGLQAVDGLLFYNGGEIAGASQPHKHLQLVPRRFTPTAPGLPIEPLLGTLCDRGGGGRAAALPFAHHLLRIEISLDTAPVVAAPRLLELYGALLDQFALGSVSPATGARQTAPYNLLATRSWMMVVPRSRECFEEMSINAIGFAGGLLARNQREVERIREVGPLRILTEVAGKRGCP